MMSHSNNVQPESIFFLSDVMNALVFLKGKEIGHLSDFIITSKDKVAEVTHIVISRPFGHPSLMVPWENVSSFNVKEIAVDLNDVEKYAKIPEGFILLKDFILDKKILDLEETEVEVVYDIKMMMRRTNFMLLM